MSKNRKDLVKMKYKILCTGDYHWGAMDADKQKDELKFIEEYLDENEIDLFVICGDYFDHRLLLNSKASIYAIDFIAKIKKISVNSKHPFKIRLFMGTKSHDNDQLDALRSLEDNTFKIFKNTEYEETLPGCHCIYCPDELMYYEDYLNTYNQVLFTNYTKKNFPIDIMFFHGTFDVIMPDILKDKDVENVIFDYAFFNSKCTVMVGGHWHDGDDYGNLYYTRSTNRFKFNEDKSKGGLLLTYDTDTQKYEIDRIDNKYTDEYKSYIIDTSLFRDQNDYSQLCSQIKGEMEENNQKHIRLQIFITDDKDINKSCIESVKYAFDNVKNVKVVVENKYTKKKKEEKKKRIADIKGKYSFLYDDSVSLVTKYRLFIKAMKNIDVDEEQLRIVLEKYL